MDNDIIIERKASLEELSGNFTTGRTRFEEEFATSKAKKKYLLIENATYSDIIEGNYNTQYNKNSFAATLHSFNHKYNLEVGYRTTINNGAYQQEQYHQIVLNISILWISDLTARKVILSL